MSGLYVIRSTGYTCDSCDRPIAMGVTVAVVEEDWLSGEAIAVVHIDCDRDGEVQP